MILPLLMLASGLFALTREEEGPTEAPTFDAESLSRLCVTREVAPGVTARFFASELMGPLQRSLGGYQLEPVTVEGGTAPGLLYKLVPTVGPVAAAESAYAAVAGAMREGFAVLASLAVSLPEDRSVKLLLVCKPEARRLAASGSQWAVLLDSATAGAAVTPDPAVADPFDSDLPAEIKSDVCKLLADATVTAEQFEQAAVALRDTKGEKDDSYPVTVSLLRARAQTLRARDRLRAATSSPAANAPSAPSAAPRGVTGPVSLGSVMGGPVVAVEVVDARRPLSDNVVELVPEGSPFAPPAKTPSPSSSPNGSSHA